MTDLLLWLNYLKTHTPKLITLFENVFVEKCCLCPSRGINPIHLAVVLSELLFNKFLRRPRDPSFAGSKPAEVDGCFRTYKSWTQVLREGLQTGGPDSEMSGSLKNLKPEKIGLRAKFNRHIHVLVIPKFGGAQLIWKGRSALVSNDHPIKTST